MFNSDYDVDYYDKVYINPSGYPIIVRFDDLELFRIIARAIHLMKQRDVMTAMGLFNFYCTELAYRRTEKTGVNWTAELVLIDLRVESLALQHQRLKEGL